MRQWISLLESMTGASDEYDQFLGLCDIWGETVQGNEFEDGGKSEVEAELMTLDHIAKNFRTVHFRSIYRGTRGITRQKAAAILRHNRSMTFDMSQSVLSSWTTNPSVAERFASKNGGIVLRYNVEDFKVFLSFSEIWGYLSGEEKRRYSGIDLGAEEAEILVINPPEIVVTSVNIHRFAPDNRLRDRSMF